MVSLEGVICIQGALIRLEIMMILLRVFDVLMKQTKLSWLRGTSAGCTYYCAVIAFQVLTGRLDNKIMSLDMHMGATPAFWRNLDAEVESISLSGFDLMVVTGASVNTYDSCNLDTSIQSSESQMDVQIKCLSSKPYF